MADVAFADRAEDRIGDGVAEHVGIAVAVEPVRVRDLDSAEDQFAPLGEAVDVVAGADEIHSCARSWIFPFHARTEILSGLSARVVISKRPPAFSTSSLPAATSHRLTLCSM